MQGSGKSTGLAIHKIPAKKRLGMSRPLLRCYTSYLFLFFIRRWLTIIHQPSAPPAKFIALGFHQLPLLLCGQLFDLCLSPGRRDLIRQILQIRRFHRKMASCIFRPFSALVCCQPFFKIIGPAGVERAVFAAEHIDARAFCPVFFRISHRSYGDGESLKYHDAVKKLRGSYFLHENAKQIPIY